MNTYITLDGYRYRTPGKTWNPPDINPLSSSRPLLDSTLDVTFGPSVLLTWTGEIEAPVYAESGEWGTIENLRTSLKKKQTLTFVDHLGNSFTIHAKGPFKERSLMPMWDAESNKFYVAVTMLAIQ